MADPAGRREHQNPGDALGGQAQRPTQMPLIGRFRHVPQPISSPPLSGMNQRVANFSSGPGYLAQDAEDRVAVARCLAGETAAFEAIVTRYERVFFTVAMRMLGDYDAARDAAQDAFISAYRRLDTYDPGRPFFSWLYRILVNGCLNDRRD